MLWLWGEEEEEEEGKQSHSLEALQKSRPSSSGQPKFTIKNQFDKTIFQIPCAKRKGQCFIFFQKVEG